MGKFIIGIKDNQQLADCEALLEKLSSHKTSRSCLYLKRLDDAHFAQAEKRSRPSTNRRSEDDFLMIKGASCSTILISLLLG